VSSPAEKIIGVYFSNERPDDSDIPFYITKINRGIQSQNGTSVTIKLLGENLNLIEENHLKVFLINRTSRNFLYFFLIFY